MASADRVLLIISRLNNQSKPHGGEKRHPHKDVRCGRAAGGTVQVADEPGAAERPQRTHTVNQRHRATRDVTRQHFRDDGKERTIRGIHGGTGDHQQGIRGPEVICTHGPRADKGKSSDQQQRPDKQFSVLQLVRRPGDDDHGDGRGQIRYGREPAHFYHAEVFAAAADNRRQPQHKAVHANAPGKVLRAEQDHVTRAEGFTIVTHRLQTLLFFVQLRLQRLQLGLKVQGLALLLLLGGMNGDSVALILLLWALVAALWLVRGYVLRKRQLEALLRSAMEDESSCDCGTGWKALAELQDRVPYPIRALALDLTDRGSFQTYADALAEEPVEVGLLVNASGFGKFRAVVDTPLEVNLNMTDLNCQAVVALCQLTAPYMPRGGQIINIASVAAFQPIPYINVYGATKAFVKQFSRNLIADLIHTRIRVTNIEPGLAESEFSLVRFHGDRDRADAVYRGTQPLTPALSAHIAELTALYHRVPGEEL